MRFVLTILLASTAALVLIALLTPRDAPHVASPQPAPIAPRLTGHLAVAAAPSPATPMPAMAAPTMSSLAMPAFALPLTERTLSAGRRAEPIEPELREAFDRIEPVMDPTRLDGPFAPPIFRIWPGTASLVDVFGEHWRLASDDANVQLPTKPYALAWHGTVAPSCDQFVKNRSHPAGTAALSALTAADCTRVRRRVGGRSEDAAPVPITGAALGLAIFAAPPPGLRMTSRDFWALQKDRIEAARLALQRRWKDAQATAGNVGLRD